jgi:hypothetical protein
MPLRGLPEGVTSSRTPWRALALALGADAGVSAGLALRASLAARASQARSGLSEATNGFRGARRNVRASPSRAFEASLRREEYLEQIRRNQKAAAIQVYVSKTPILLRLIFLPLWAAAAMLGSVVVPEVRAPVRAVKFFATMLLVAACGAAWFQIFDVVVAFL